MGVEFWGYLGLGTQSRIHKGLSNDVNPSLAFEALHDTI